MAEIVLRDYLSEIESLIERSSYDEAIANCRHILEQRPKCLEAYRLLGKAALEKEDDRAAIDIFQRVLSVDPEDFVARVGLSIVYDRQGTLDDAVWQMERGFELMPSNDVIQSELRRLYGRRDGVAPERIALTRGALARMYAQGDLYAEAIGELRALLKESPDRVDLQVLLAEVLWRDDQLHEAASVAERLLEKLPYCLTANLVLGQIWSNSGFSEDGETFLRRAQAIDPDNVRANTLLGAASPLGEQSIHVTRLAYQAPAAPSYTEQVAADQVPEWLAGLAGIALDQPESAALPGLPAPQPAPAIELGPAGEADLPDWLTGAAQTAAEPATEPGRPTTDEIPGWMGGFWDQTQAPAEESQAVAGPELEAVPDWLSQFEQPAAPVESSAEPAAPEWPEQLGAVDELVGPARALPSTDWLRDFGAAPGEPAQPEEAPASLEQADVPDWLQALRPTVPESATPPVELPEVEESEMPEWMVGAQETPASDQAFDFLQRLSESAAVEPAQPVVPPAKIPEAPHAGQPAEEVEEFAVSEAEGMPSPDDALAFFARLTAGKEDQLSAQAEQEAEAHMADIMGRKPAEQPSPPKPAAPEPARPTAPPAPARPVAPAESAAMPSPEDALAFLQSLAAGKEEELRAQAER